MTLDQAGLMGGGGGVSVASSTAVVKISIWRVAMTPIPNFACTISPCSVTRSEPWMEPGGCDWMARCIGPPPRPMEPPRPWNSVSEMPNVLHTSTTFSWQV